jgi:CHAT domain-containing protein
LMLDLKVHKGKPRSAPGRRLRELGRSSILLPKLVAGEGVTGLARAFLYAGAESVLTSVWNVNDASTAEIMKSMYRNINRGLPRDEALRQAKLTMSRGAQTAWRHPYYWAPFVLMGSAGR